MKTTRNIYFKLTIFLLVLIPVFVQAQGIEITAGGSITITGSAKIEINNGNFINNGIYTKGAESVTLSGNSAKTLSGSGSTDMYDLMIDNTGGATTKLPQLNLHNLTIHAGSKLTIDTTRAVNVSNVVRNKATVNDLILLSNQNAANGSLIFHNVQDSAVNATVQMYCKASKPSSYKWQFIGIPLRSALVDDFSSGSYVRQQNEAGTGSGYTSDKLWIQLVNGCQMTSFTAYEVTQVSPKTITFMGELENRNYSSGKLSITTGAQYPGQHLIGNPYTAAIDIKKIEFGSPRVEVIDNTIYLYNTGSLSDWTTGGSGQAGESPGQYIGIPANLAGENNIPSQIPSMQAFLIVAVSNNDSANIKIPYSSVGTMVKNADKQRVRATSSTSTRINIKGSRFEDKMWIFTNENCTRGYENGWDAQKIQGSSYAPQLYSMEASGDYQVNTVDNINNTDIGFIPGEDSEYTLTFTNENLENQYTNLYLQDLVENRIIDITASGTQYTFTTQPSATPIKRFKIVTSAGQTTGELKITNPQRIKIFNSGKIVFIDNQTSDKGTITICSSSGKVCLSSRISANKITSIETNALSGYYIATVVTNSETATVKMLISDTK
jgi:hypothetical protein